MSNTFKRYLASALYKLQGTFDQVSKESESALDAVSAEVNKAASNLARHLVKDSGAQAGLSIDKATRWVRENSTLKGQWAKLAASWVFADGPATPSGRARVFNRTTLTLPEGTWDIWEQGVRVPNPKTGASRSYRMKLAEAAPVACDTELVIRRKSDGSWGIKPAPASKIITDITPQREEPLVEEAEPSQLGKLVQDECIEEQSELGEEPVPVEPLEEYVPFVETKVTAPQLILFGLGVICALAAAVACILPYGLIPDSGVTTWIPAVALTAGATGSFVTLAWGKSKTAFIVNSILVASLGGTLAASVDYSLWPWLLASATLAFAAVMSFPEHIGAQTEEPSAKVEELAPSDEFAVPAYSN